MINAFCINLDRQINRWVNFQKNVSPYLNDFSIERLSAIHLNEISIKEQSTKSLLHRRNRRLCELSNLESFGTCIKIAKERKYPYVGIFEDDCYFKYTYKNNQISDIIENELKGQDWGVLYLGCYFKNSTKGTLSSFSPSLLKFNNDNQYTIWGAHAIVYNSTVYDEFLKYVFNKDGKYRFITDPYICHVLVKKYQSFVLKRPLLYQDKAYLSTTSMHGRFNFNSLEGENESVLRKIVV